MKLYVKFNQNVCLCFLLWPAVIQFGNIFVLFSLFFHPTVHQNQIKSLWVFFLRQGGGCDEQAFSNLKKIRSKVAL